ncbi:MAG: alpha/beta hydrolase, partial [Pseudomonadota bacterium]
ISSPWGGVQSAQSGVKWAPTVPPVWRDIDPDSDYLAMLFDTTLPESIPYHLLFGFRQDSLLGRDSSDGVIKLESQLRLDAQEQAQLVRGFDEGHVTILSNADVISLVNEILQREDHTAD